VLIRLVLIPGASSDGGGLERNNCNWCGRLTPIRERRDSRETSDAYILGRRIKYLDPLAICEAKHHGPNTWKEDHDLFKNCKTPAQIAKE